MYEVYDFRFREKDGLLKYVVYFKNKLTNDKEKEYGDLYYLDDIPTTPEDRNDFLIATETLIYNQVINMPTMDATYKVHDFIKDYFNELVVEVDNNA